jgi:hypothetical protein
MPSAPTLNAAAASVRVTFRIIFMSCTSSRGKGLSVTLYPLSRRFEPADMSAMAHFIAMHIPADEDAAATEAPMGPSYAR